MEQGTLKLDYQLLNRSTKSLLLTGVDTDVAEYFTSNNLQLSAEELKNGWTSLYSTTGLKDEEGVDIEYLCIASYEKLIKDPSGVLRQLRAGVEQYRLRSKHLLEKQQSEI